jgi:phosphoribosylformimino-5-aminoimidazole carboxamide ribotide isomerase
MAFRPCIDLKDGRVVQIVGGTLTDDGQAAVNHVSAQSAAEFAALYRRDGLRGGHVILLGAGNQSAALDSLRAYPGGLQVGGGITPENAGIYLDAGASHVIVTSFLFENGVLSLERLQQMADMVGKHRLVVDLSCRRGTDDAYYVATNRWQTVTSTRLSQGLVGQLEPYCDEFLVHAADVEGRQAGIDEELVTRLGEWVSIPTTYAGGAKALDDIRRVAELSKGKVDLTIGSALDIFGGSLIRYADAARLAKT